MSLTDTNARPIFVQFKLLEIDTPKGVAEMFSEPFLAEHRAASQGRFTVTLPGDVVEKLLASRKAEPGSFSEFVWTFDSLSGEVISAEVSGILNQTVDLGFFDIKIDAAIEIRMDTLVPAGEGKPRNLMGHRISKFCQPLDDKDCQSVDPVDYDSATGRVKAVGSLFAKTSIVNTRTLAPLGMAIFSEVPENRFSATEPASLPSVSAN